MLAVFAPLVALLSRELAIKNDLLLQQRVIDELEFEPKVEAAHIGVSVRGGVVRAASTALSRSSRLSARCLA
jgi:osmotically-inducible protein OsmY